MLVFTKSFDRLMNEAAGTEVHLEHLGGFVVLGHALEHSVRGQGCRVPEPHHPPQHLHNTLNLPVVAWQPHPDPNYASFVAACCVAGA